MNRLRHPRGTNRRGERSRRSVALAAAAGLAALAGSAAALQAAPLLVWNVTASAPIGLYRGLPDAAVRRGDLVLVQPPDAVRALAAERGYLPAGVPLIKQVIALDGDEVCARGDTILLNGIPVATRRACDGAGRPLPGWSGCRRLDDGAVFLLMPGVADSFDGRYFGPIPADGVIEKLVPLWTG